MAIVFRAAGAKANGTGAVTPALPAGLVANDICILVATTIAGGTMSITADGSVTPWTAITGSPVDVASGEKVWVWWGRFSSGSTGPTVTPGSDHACAGIAAWSGCITDATVINQQATGSEAVSDTSLSFATGVSTSVNNCMVLLVSTSGEDTNTPQHSAQANTSLTSIAERMDYQTVSGGGGGFECVEGLLATAGSMGTWTATLAVASTKAYLSFALKPGATTTNQSVTASTVASTASAVKQAAKSVTASVVSSTATATKGLSKSATATTVNATATLAEAATFGRIVTASAVAGTATLVRGVAKSVVAGAVSSAASAVKSVGKIVGASAVSSAASVGTAATFLRSVTATTVTSVASVARILSAALMMAAATAVHVASLVATYVGGQITGKPIAHSPLGRFPGRY